MTTAVAAAAAAHNILGVEAELVLWKKGQVSTLGYNGKKQGL